MQEQPRNTKYFLLSLFILLMRVGSVLSDYARKVKIT